MSDSSGQEFSRFDRRPLLKGIGKVALAGGIGLLFGKGSAPESPASLEAQIESKFGIIVDSPGENNVGERPTLTARNPKVAWDRPRLAIINGILENVPSNFYSPQLSKNGEKNPLKITLLDRQDHFAFCSCALLGEGLSVPYPTIEFSTKTLSYRNKEEVRNARASVIHELTHYVTIPGEIGLIEKIAGKIGINSNEELSQIFDFDHFQESVSFSDDRNSIRLSGLNFREFFAVAGQFYVEGKDRFLSLYGEVLGMERAVTLYQGMREEVFQGYEYKNFIAQNKPHS